MPFLLKSYLFPSTVLRATLFFMVLTVRFPGSLFFFQSHFEESMRAFFLLFPVFLGEKPLSVLSPELRSSEPLSPPFRV